MIRPSTLLAGWGAMLTVLAVVLLLWSPPQDEWALLIGAAIGLAPLGWIMLVPGGRADEPRPLPDTSLPTVVVATGIAVVVLGLAAGPWLAVVGAEILLLGGIALIRELRAQRRARRS